MAAKRFFKSSIDWIAFAERVPEREKPKFHLFKSRSDGYLKRVMGYPEKPPEINWAEYRSRLPTPALVDEFEKQYKSLKVPYPADTQTAAINAQEQTLSVHMKEFIEVSDIMCQYYNKKLNWHKEMLPFDEMTLDDFRDYFPDQAYDPFNRPSFWPHDEPPRPVFPWREKKHH